MTDLNRRHMTLLALLAPFAAVGKSAEGETSSPAHPEQDHDMSSMPASWTRPDQIAMLVYPKMTALDLIGPQYLFASLMGSTVHLVGQSLAPVTSDTGVTITPTVTFENCPRDLTVLFAPGGTNGTLAVMQDAATLAFMADRGSRARYVTSVCTGSLILGAAGLLKGYKATSHWSARDVLADFGAIPTDARVVRDRNRITGAGVTAGLDFGLQMVAELRDANYAQNVELLCEYDPQPPFHSGSLHTASPEVQSTMRGMLAGFVSRAHDVAKKDNS
jgi:putative intracellular protease/amidase